MADNAYRTNPGSGELIRTVDKSGVEAQVVVLDLGGSGSEALAGDAGVGLPVESLRTVTTGTLAVVSDVVTASVAGMAEAFISFDLSGATVTGSTGSVSFEVFVPGAGWVTGYVRELNGPTVALDLVGQIAVDPTLSGSSIYMMKLNGATQARVTLITDDLTAGSIDVTFDVRAFLTGPAQILDTGLGLLVRGGYNGDDNGNNISVVIDGQTTTTPLYVTGDQQALSISQTTVTTNTTTSSGALSSVATGQQGRSAAPAFYAIYLATADACDADCTLEVSYDNGATYTTTNMLWSALTGFGGPPADISTWLSGVWYVPAAGITRIRLTTANITTGGVQFNIYSVTHAPIWGTSAGDNFPNAVPVIIDNNVPVSVQGSAEYADGTAWSAGLRGIPTLAVRSDGTGNLSGVADGDFTPLTVDGDGQLRTSVAGSVTVSPYGGSIATTVGAAAGATGTINVGNLSVSTDTGTGATVLSVQLVNSSFVGTLAFQYLSDNTTWATVPSDLIFDVTAQQWGVTSINPARYYLVDVRSLKSAAVRVIRTAFTSGSVAVQTYTASVDLPPWRAAASTDVSLASSAASAQVLAANTARRGLMLTNTDANDCYLYYGTTAIATKFTVIIPAGGYWEMPQPIYTGRIDAIWAADGSGSLIGSEL